MRKYEYSEKLWQESLQLLPGGVGGTPFFTQRAKRRTMEKTSRCVVVVTILAQSVFSLMAAEPRAPSAREILAHLNKEHPRLLVSAKGFEQLRQQISADPTLREWHDQLRKRAEQILTEPPSRYEIPDGLRLLATSRRVLDRVYTLGLLYRLDGDRKYAERAWTELDAAARFPDWNPRHFLDTAEMTHAFAIGYDWFYDVWTKEQRGMLRAAIVKKGLEPALGIYRGEVRSGWWTKARHNWNQVCNGGIGIGALAIGDEVPDLAGEILQDALQSLPLAMTQYAPDGAWAEGPGYWQYATSYNVAFLAALDSALGTDFGLSQIGGFSEAGWFPIYMTGPLGRTFNFADAHDGSVHAPEMFWLAHRFHRPAYARYEERFAMPAPLDLLWRGASAPRGEVPDLPLDKYFRGAEVVSLRSSWTDRDAVFVGFKAGDNKVNHSHLDLGSFVIDALAERWVADLGPDDYNLPGYFGKQRWEYYRLRAEGHNTLVINPGAEPDQDPKAGGRIIRFESQPQKAFAIADLTAAYATHARKVQRGIALLNRQQVLVEDEILADKPDEVWWFLHTPAKIVLSADGRSATLEQGAARLWARILSPQNVVFTELEPQPLSMPRHPDGQEKNKGVHKLSIHLKDVTDVRLAVLLVPLGKGQTAPSELPPVNPLAKW